MTLRILEVAKTSLKVTGSTGKVDRKDGKAYEENFSRATTGRGKLFDFFLFTNLNIRAMTSTGDQTGGRQQFVFFPHSYLNAQYAVMITTVSMVWVRSKTVVFNSFTD